MATIRFVPIRASCRIPEAIPMNLKSMSLDRLMNLRDKVEAALKVRVFDERKTLQSELAKLSRFDQRAGAKLVTRRGGTVAPKYRNPDNPSETWAGRGLMPRWLAAAMKTGKRLEYFSIAAQGAKRKKVAKKTRKAAKPGKRQARRNVRARRAAPASTSPAPEAAPT
jgi:DNA-binding protein H-NS